MQTRIKRGINFPLWGLLGSGVITLGALLSAVPYRGVAGEAYSPFNHFISELGEVGVSRLAALFNGGLIVGGLLLVLFMWGLGAFLGNPVAYLAGAAGAFAALSCGAVGVFPMNNLHLHGLAATSFFWSGMVTVALFSLATLLDRRGRMSKWFALPGALAAACFAIFLFLPRQGEPRSQVQAFEILTQARPAWWGMAVSEWSVFFAVLGWVVGVSVYHLLVRRT